MADHRAEQILDAVTESVTGLTTTGDNVERGRFFPIDECIPEAITVSQGALAPFSEPNLAYQDSQLEVIVKAHAKGADGTVESTINKIAKEVYVAMLADRTLGLAWVHDTSWQGNGEPTLDSAEQPIISMEITFSVVFRHSYTDPSA